MDVSDLVLTHVTQHNYMLPPNPTAQEVSEHLLDLTGRALMNGDVVVFSEAFGFPFELETESGKRLYNHAHEIHGIFQALHDHLRQMRVTMLARHCVAAQFRTPDEVVATHETRLISDGLLIEDPFPTLSVIVRDETDAWRIRSSSYYVPDNSIYRSALDT